MKKLGLRHKLYTSQDKPKCEGASFNGVEVRKLIDDILKADGKPLEGMVGKRKGSLLLRCLYRTAKALGDNGFIENIPRFAAFLLDWAKATLISLKMKPTVSERASFAGLCRGYIIKKRMVFDTPGGSWYDNTFMSVLPELMHKYGTLGLYNQQALEGAMRLRRRELRSHAVTHRAGRRPGWAHGLGREGTDLLMEERDAKAQPINTWIQRKMLHHYYNHPLHKPRFDRVEELLAEGRTLSQEEFARKHMLHRIATQFAARLVARTQLKWARAAGNDYYTRLAAAVRSYGATALPSGHEDAGFDVPAQGVRLDATHAKAMDTALSARWKNGAGARVFRELWEWKGSVLVSKATLLKAAQAQARRAP
jgi:hypothetical protein